MEKLFILLIVALSFSSYSQSNYYFGYQDGFKYGCNCNDLPPKNVAYSQGTYDQGYSDGKLDGVVYTNRKTSTQSNQQNYNQPHNYNDVPLYKHDTELIERVLADKQQKLDERRTSIYYKLQSVWSLIQRVKEKNGEYTDAQLKYITSFANGVTTISGYDYSIYQNYLNALDWLNKIETEVLKWL